MLISTTNQLNKLIASVGVISPADIVTLLADKKIVVSPTIYRLIQEKAA